MNINKELVSKSKYNVKCPYVMKPKGICVHNTANDASAKNEVSYMKGNNNQVSYHIAVDDIEAIQAIPFDRNTWHAGDGSSGNGNRNYISIEICYSKSGGPKFNKAEKNAAEIIAQLLKQYGWGIGKVKKHQDFSGKYCPHRTLDMGWNRFLNMIQKEMKGADIKVDDKKELSKIKISLHGKQLETDGIHQDGINYIPIRFLEKLGYQIGWQDETVTINYKGEE
ncbi:peptidoglycan recognition protein family protein [Sporanaerobacter sp. PP17-6a]|uniref:peptidoglycan recognition protein family protein n=1 Tax=Sporanaerobacter sp. PP17-6a TaxID=1891289 RepID=UPI0008A0835D|nr:N-acetylmuramoyl-L-alanine amidase [Sporanaerobacter sp. PP17-6a]SCL88130.1 N-acetylmuramoyl-L-alanine amidase CwlA precursor [Sporanaerobacter sp. PP17-6a]